MNKDILTKILNNEKLQDIPILYIVRIAMAIMEEEYDNEDRP